MLSSIKMSQTGNMALQCPEWCGLCFQHYVNLLPSLHHPSVFISSVHFANAFWLKSAPFLLHLQVNPGMRPESLLPILISIVSPPGCVPLRVCFSGLFGDVTPSLLEFPSFFLFQAFWHILVAEWWKPDCFAWLACFNVKFQPSWLKLALLCFSDQPATSRTQPNALRKHSWQLDHPSLFQICGIKFFFIQALWFTTDREQRHVTCFWKS